MRTAPIAKCPWKSETEIPLEVQKAPRRVPQAKHTKLAEARQKKLNEFDTSHRRIVAVAGAELQDPGVATVAGGVAGSNFGK